MDPQDADLIAKIQNDMYQTKTEMYQENILDTLRDWLHTHNITIVQGDKNITTGSGNAKTGETIPFVMIISLIALAGTGLSLSKKKKVVFRGFMKL